MKKEIIINCIVVLLLTALVILTLAPIVLMFKASLASVGTLTKGFDEIRLPADKKFKNIARFRMNQDARKFSQLSFKARGINGHETFEAILYDINGAWCSVDSDKYLPGGLQKDWLTVKIPAKAFDIAELNNGFPEKVVDVLIIKAKTDKAMIALDNINIELKKVSLANYLDVIISASFGRYFFNSALIAIIITIGNLFFCTLAGYAFARKDFPFKDFLFTLILVSIIIPPQVLIIPVFILMKDIGWLNTYLALIAPSLVQPFGIFLMRQYISSLPASLEDQARVDGATESQILFKIIFPLSRPALAIVGINTFMGSWNTFLFPFLLTNTPQMRTLPVGLALYKNLQGADWVHLMAASSLTGLPVILVFLLFQKHIIAGLTTGLVKR